METNFQLLMLSSNLLKSKIHMSDGGGGGGGGGGGACGNQFPTFDAEFKFTKIQNSHVGGGGGGRAHGNQFQNFDAESKFAQIQNSHVR